MSTLPAYELGSEFRQSERRVLQRFIDGEDFSPLEREQLAYCFRRVRVQHPQLTAQTITRCAKKAGSGPGDLCLVSFWELIEEATIRSR
jgi:hypothetical protein